MSAAARSDWPAVALAIGLGVLAATYIGKAPPALPLLQRDFAMDLAAAGWVAAMFNMLAMVAGIFFGLLADRLGAFNMALAGLAALAAGGAAGALAPDAAWLLAGRFVEGAGFIAVAVSAPSLIARACGADDLRRALGLWSIYMPSGGALAMFAAPLALAALGWRALWAALTLATVAVAAWLWRWRGRYRARAAPPRRFADLAAGLRHPAAWLFAAAFGCYALQFFTVVVWLPTFLVQSRGVGVSAASLLTATVVAVNVAGNLLGVWLLQRHVGRGAIVMLAQAAIAGTVLVAFAEAAPDGLRFAACLAMSAIGGMLPTACLSSAQVLARSGAQIGAIQGLMIQGSNVGQFLAPPLITAVVAGGDWAAAGPVLLGCAAIAFACGALARRSGV